MRRGKFFIIVERVQILSYKRRAAAAATATAARVTSRPETLLELGARVEYPDSAQFERGSRMLMRAPVTAAPRASWVFKIWS